MCVCERDDDDDEVCQLALYLHMMFVGSMELHGTTATGGRDTNESIITSRLTFDRITLQAFTSDGRLSPGTNCTCNYCHSASSLL